MAIELSDRRGKSINSRPPSPSSIFPLILRPTRYPSRGSSLINHPIPLSLARHPLFSQDEETTCLSLSLFSPMPPTLAGYSIYLLSRPPTRGVRPVWTFLPCVIYYPVRTRLARRRRCCPSFTHVHQPLLTTTGLLVSLSLARAHAPTRTHMHSRTHIHTHQQPLDIPRDHPVSYHASFSSGTRSFSLNARRLILI